MINLIGVKELARHLGISQKALRIRVGKGKVAQPVKREGSELFWDRTVLGNKPLDNQTHKSINEIIPGHLPTVLDDRNNSTAPPCELDASIILQRTPFTGGTTMRIVKGRQS